MSYLWMVLFNTLLWIQFIAFYLNFIIFISIYCVNKDQIWICPHMLKKNIKKLTECPYIFTMSHWSLLQERYIYEYSNKKQVSWWHFNFTVLKINKDLLFFLISTILFLHGFHHSWPRVNIIWVFGRSRLLHTKMKPLLGCLMSVKYLTCYKYLVLPF